MYVPAIFAGWQISIGQPSTRVARWKPSAVRGTDETT